MFCYYKQFLLSVLIYITDALWQACCWGTTGLCIALSHLAGVSWQTGCCGPSSWRISLGGCCATKLLVTGASTSPSQVKVRVEVSDLDSHIALTSYFRIKLSLCVSLFLWTAVFMLTLSWVSFPMLAKSHRCCSSIFLTKALPPACCFSKAFFSSWQWFPDLYAPWVGWNVSFPKKQCLTSYFPFALVVLQMFPLHYSDVWKAR